MPEKREKPNSTISIYTDKETIRLLDELVWLNQYTKFENTTRGSIVKRALDLLKVEMKYDKVRKKFEKQLDAIQPQVGRRKG